MEPLSMREEPENFLSTGSIHVVDINGRHPALWRRWQESDGDEQSDSGLSGDQVARRIARGITDLVFGNFPSSPSIRRRGRDDNPHARPAPDYQGRRHYRFGNGDGEPRESYRDRCLSVPLQLKTPRIEKLAKQWTEGENTTFTRCLAIENHFHTDFEYTLDQPNRVGNKIEDFLFRHRAGHCEYFATSMAMLVRTLGIPSRVVNGYYSVEWNDSTRSFTVRQSDAHSWVEVYMGNYGWMTFDPTPPSGIGRPNTEILPLRRLSRMIDTLKVRWYRYVVDFDAGDQADIIRRMAAKKTKILSAENRFQWSGFEGLGLQSLLKPMGAIPWLGSVIVLMTIALILGALLYQIFNRTIRRNSESRLTRAYTRLLKRLSNAGYKIAPGQTPREFSTEITQKNPTFEGLRQITEKYYNARYRTEKEPSGTQQLIREIQTFATNLRRSPRKP
jgi:transglutaminase-like putative cysteine protease